MAEVRAAATPRRLALGAAVVIAIVGVGAATARRYPYRVRDELAWADAVSAPTAAEPQVLQAGEKAFTAPRSDTDAPALAAWLRDSALPFYERWRAAVVALPLSPGYATAKRRNALVKVLTMKIDSYQALLAGMGHHDTSAFDRFANDQIAIEKAIGAMGRADAP